MTRLDRALRAEDVDALCRPGAVVTAAVVTELGDGGEPCEQAVEQVLAGGTLPALTVRSLVLQPRSAQALVQVGTGRSVRLTLLRDRMRWTVSFSGGADPLGAILRAAA